MKPGSVIVDMAASAARRQRRAVEARRDGRHRQRRDDPGARRTCRPRCPPARSQFYARNISTFLLHFMKDGAMASTRPTRSRPPRSSPSDGRVVQAATAKLLEPPAAASEAHRSEPRAAQRAGDLPAGDPRRLRGHQQGPGDAAHAADVGANSIHGIVMVGAMLIAAAADNSFSYVLAFIAMVFGAAKRRRWLRRHRPHAPDVPQAPHRAAAGRAGRRRQGQAADSMSTLDTVVFLVWLAARGLLRARPAPDELARPRRAAATSLRAAGMAAGRRRHLPVAAHAG